MLSSSVKYSIFSQCLRIVSGPISLLFLSTYFSSEQLGFYYSFFSIQATSQLIEAGLGFVIMQSVARKMGRLRFRNGTLLGRKEDRLPIYQYFFFLIFWQLCVAFVFFLVAGVTSVYIFSGYEGTVEWKFPLLLLVIATAVNLCISGLGAMIEGFQRPEIFYKHGLFSSAVSTSTFLLCISAGFDLYSAGVSQLVSSFVLFFLNGRYLFKFLSRTYFYRSNKSILSFLILVRTFSEIRPYFSKISLTWILGYFYWNGLNLVAFKYGGAVFAGQVGFTLAIVKAIGSVSESFVITKRGLFAKLIGEQKADEARRLFEKANFITLILFCCGVLIIAAGYRYAPLNIIEKIFDFYNTILFALGYLCIVLITNMALFVRCHHVEPFVIFSATQTLALVAGAYVILVYLSPKYLAIYYALIHLFYLLWCYVIYKKTIQTTRNSSIKN